MSAPTTTTTTTFAKVVRRLGFGVACGGCGYGSLVRAKTLEGATCPRCGRSFADAAVAPEPTVVARVVPTQAQVDAAAFFQTRGCCRSLP